MELARCKTCGTLRLVSNPPTKDTILCGKCSGAWMTNPFTVTKWESVKILWWTIKIQPSEIIKGWVWTWPKNLHNLIHAGLNPVLDTRKK
jgi:hypothetical protein